MTGIEQAYDWTGAPALPGGGDLVTDPALLSGATTDLGNLVHAVPGAILRPGSSEDVAVMLRWCAERGVAWRPRGARHTTHGQGVVDEGGLQIDVRSLATVHEVGPGGAVADAGATVRDVVLAAAEKGLRLAAGTTGYTRLTLGGVCSAGGISNRPDAGALIDTVTSAEVVTPDGAMVVCGRDAHPDLFHAVLGGFGTAGVLTRVTVGVVDLPGQVRTWQLPYGVDTLPEMLSDLRILARRGEVDELYVIFQEPARHTYVLTVSAYHGPEQPAPDAGHLLRDLSRPAPAEHADLGYLDHTLAIDALYDSVEGAGWPASTKVWTDVFLPDSGLDPVVTAALPGLAAREFSATSFGLIFPKRRARFGTGRLALPAAERPGDDTEPVFLFDLLKDDFGLDDDEWVPDMLARHAEHVDLATRHGGVVYPIGTSTP